MKIKKLGLIVSVLFSHLYPATQNLQVGRVPFETVNLTGQYKAILNCAKETFKLLELNEKFTNLAPHSERINAADTLYAEVQSLQSVVNFYDALKYEADYVAKLKEPASLKERYNLYLQQQEQLKPPAKAPTKTTLSQDDVLTLMLQVFQMKVSALEKTNPTIFEVKKDWVAKADDSIVNKINSYVDVTPRKKDLTEKILKLASDLPAISKIMENLNNCINDLELAAFKVEMIKYRTKNQENVIRRYFGVLDAAQPESKQIELTLTIDKPVNDKIFEAIRNYYGLNDYQDHIKKIERLATAVLKMQGLQATLSQKNAAEIEQMQPQIKNAFEEVTNCKHAVESITKESRKLDLQQIIQKNISLPNIAPAVAKNFWTPIFAEIPGFWGKKFSSLVQQTYYENSFVHNYLVAVKNKDQNAASACLANLDMIDYTLPGFAISDTKKWVKTFIRNTVKI